ncbi:DUF4249 domain-containing protein [Niabella beijingensis]|uniref:DUF4249 domain-containing protein n=1 Tax=Niabella beijingensis TaxID=2872700 RepID=UPI001CBC6762|nr:DUF4249 domain-containing protein [Niabella beijingensis]MBZ4191598.1 DUF4249 domain-containing protein [Niabella beijingensis]
MMTNCKYIFGICLLLTTLFSCRKVIYPDFDDDGTRKTVIEASVSDLKDTAIVFISETLAIYEPNSYSGKDGAVVSIARDDSTPVLLTNLGNGRFGGHLTASTGSSYTLHIRTETEQFSARSVMPAKIRMDSLFITRRTILGRNLRIPTVVFRDPPAPGNYYRFILWVDGFENTTIFIENDRLFNGNQMTMELLDVFTDEGTPTFVDKYDRVTVEMQCITKETYDYLYQLKGNALGDGGTANPGNPGSNITGGALGYFSVHTSERKELFAD